MATVFDEWFGEIDATQYKTYKRNNVSPADHNTLVICFGDDAKAITAFVKEHSTTGQYREPYPIWKAIV